MIDGGDESLKMVDYNYGMYIKKYMYEDLVAFQEAATLGHLTSTV